jgi:hypothetical protein
MTDTPRSGEAIHELTITRIIDAPPEKLFRA